jgi:hypothetical protein
MSKITIYNNVTDRTGQGVIEIQDFLIGIGSGKWRSEVERYRRGEIEKKTLPCVTVSGVFEPTRAAENLKSHSGYIAFDFDKQDASRLAEDPYTHCLFVSCSGSGHCCIVKIDSKQFKDSWSQLCDYYRDKHNLFADPSCKDVSRLRFVSYDPKAYMNDKSLVFYALKKEPRQEFKKELYFHTANNFEFVLEQIQNSGVDLTADYADWIKIGMALKAEFGDAGLDYFKIVSQCHPGYDEKQTEAKFKGFKPTKTTIGTFYYLAKLRGLQIKSERTKDILQAVSVVKKNGGNKDGLVKQLETIGITPDEKEIALFDRVAFEKPDDINEKDYVRLGRLFLGQYDLWLCEIRKRVFLGNELLTDRHVAQIWEQMQNSGIKLSKSQVSDLIENNHIQKRDPLRDYFKEWETEGTDLIEKWMSAIPFLHKEFSQKMLRYWFMGVMENLYTPMPLPYCLILCGKLANTGKTQALRNLLPEDLYDWFGETDLRKYDDARRAMCEKLIVFNDEFAGNMVKDSSTFKSLLSGDKYTIRMPYARYAEDYKRIGSVCATSNEEGLIYDKSTNNRRIFPVEVVSEIDWKIQKSIDKRKLWGQVYWAWKTNTWPAIMTSQDIQELNQMSNDYSEKEYLEEFVIENIIEDKDWFMSLTEIKESIQPYVKNEISIMALGRFLNKQGFKKVRKKTGYNIKTGYNVRNTKGLSAAYSAQGSGQAV